jgi:hypothetical protein
VSLDNLVKIGQLKPHVPSAGETQRLLAAVARNLKDAHAAGISDEGRFDAGYKAIMQCALVTLLASGYRPPNNVQGHHQTMIQSLGLTLGVPNDTWVVLDALRRKRNLNDYTGDLIDSASVQECIARAEALARSTREWLAAHHPELLEKHQ